MPTPTTDSAMTTRERAERIAAPIMIAVAATGDLNALADYIIRSVEDALREEREANGMLCHRAPSDEWHENTKAGYLTACAEIEAAIRARI